jgi:hypothetical protein
VGELVKKYAKMGLDIARCRYEISNDSELANKKVKGIHTKAGKYTDFLPNDEFVDRRQTPRGHQRRSSKIGGSALR